MKCVKCGSTKVKATVKDQSITNLLLPWTWALATKKKHISYTCEDCGHEWSD